MTTGEKIKKLREQNHLSVRDLEKKIDIDRYMIYRIESNSRNLTQENIIKICKFFGISSDWLLGLKDNLNI